MTLQQAEFKWTPFVERRFLMAGGTIGFIATVATVLLWFRRLDGSAYVTLVLGVVGVAIPAYFGAKYGDKRLEKQHGGPGVSPDPQPGT